MTSPKAQGFGLMVIVYDPYVESDVAEKYGVEIVGLEQLLKESGSISVHAAIWITGGRIGRNSSPYWTKSLPPRHRWRG